MSRKQPPKLANKLLKWFCKPELLEEIQGDLHADFERKSTTEGKWKTSLNYWLQVLNFLRPFALKENQNTYRLKRYDMLRNHLKIARRTILKYRNFTAINLFGLAVGISCFTVIMLYIYDELSYDKYHADAEKIYRVTIDRVLKGGAKNHTVWTETALASAIEQEIPEIDKVTRICRNPAWGKASLTYKEDQYYDDKGLYVDNTFFDVFSFSFVQGSKESAFESAESVILTASLARKFFGDESAIGKTLHCDHYTFNRKPLRVSGVVEDVPFQSHFTFDFLVPISSTLSKVRWWKEGTWDTDNTVITYIKLSNEIQMNTVSDKIQHLANLHRKDNLDTYSIQPMTGLNGIHLSSQRSGELDVNSQKANIKVTFIIALFVVLIAGINYINLSTARSATRTKEIGVRKVIGAGRKSLILQFLTESVLMSFLAGFLSLGITQLSLPFFNSVMQKHLSLFVMGSMPIWVLIVLVIITVGFVAGLYPAAFLSSFKPISMLKKPRNSETKRFSFRRVLVVFQFGLAALLIIGVMVVQKQLDYLQSTNLGFEKDQIIVIKNFVDGDPNRVMRQTLKELPGVLNVGASGQPIGLMDNSWMTSVHVKGSDNSQPILWGAYIDENYLDVMGIEVRKGRNFSQQLDKVKRGMGSNIILNETAIKMLSVPEPVVGQDIVTDWGKEFKIVGVVNDFHSSSLHNKILPLAFVYVPFVEQSVVLKIAKGNINETIQGIQKAWDGFAEDVPMDFYFLDAELERQYKSEQNFKAIFSVMTGLSILIACLGLFGLVAFTAEQRTKEIGIRKILGASVPELIGLLIREYIWLVVIANIIAWPIAFAILGEWLENFAYHINIGWTVFLISGLLALIVALLTASFHTYKTAVANPVQALRDE